VDKPIIDSLSERVERLESECKRLRRHSRLWKALGTLALFGTLVLAAGGAQKLQPPDDLAEFRTIVGKQFVLVGPDATLKKPDVRAVLGTHKGSTNLHFLGPKNESLLSLGTDPDGTSGLTVSGKDGKPRIQLVVSPDLATGLTFLDGSENDLLSLYVTKDGIRSLRAHDKGGKERLRLILNPDGDGGLVVSDRDGKNQLALGTNSEGQASLRILDKDGLDVIGLGVSAEHVPVFIMRDKEGRIIHQVPQP
jgi:hypothetical protein